jgi:hypothetical protein
MKVIELTNRVLFLDDIIQIFEEYSTYYVATKNGTCKITKNDYFKIKNCLLSLNDKVEILEEEKKIPEKLYWNKNDFTYPEGNLMSEETADMLMEIQDKVNFILDYLKRKGK